VNYRPTTRAIMPLLACFASCAALASPALASQLSAKPANLSRSIDVRADSATVWSAIGSFCAIADWHPAVGSCTLDGKAPPTRTLTTRDGATFVELEVQRDDAQHLYAYTFTSSPLPVTRYRSTLRVLATGNGTSRIEWSSTFTPAAGKEQAARDALTGIYESGLTAIKSRLDPSS